MDDRRRWAVLVAGMLTMVATCAFQYGLPFLVPGVGAQGGEIAPVLADGPAREAPGGRVAGGGLLVNVTRGIAAAAAGLTSEREVAEALGKAAAEWAERLPVLP